MKSKPGSTLAPAREGHGETRDWDAPDELLFVADYLTDTPLPIRFAGRDEYEGQGEWSAASMARLHAYQRLLPHITSANQLVAHLSRYPEIAERLGFDAIPNDRTINRSWSKQFTGTTRENLESYIESARERLLDAPDHVAAAVSRRVKTADGVSIPEQEKERAYTKVEDRLRDLIDYGRGENARIPAETLTDFATYIARRNTFAEQGAERWAVEEANGGDEVFSPETFRQAIRQKGRDWAVSNTAEDRAVHPDDDVDDLNWQLDPHDHKYGGDENWHSITEDGIGKAVETLREAGALAGEVPICIDGSIRPYHKHGSTDADRPTGVHWRGAQMPRFGWEDLSAVAIIDGRAVVLANINYTPEDELFECVKYLVDRCRDLVDVECFYGDAEFGNTDIMRYIDHVGEKYVFKAREHGGVKNVLAEFEGEADWTEEFTLNSTRKGIRYETNLFAIESDHKSEITPSEERGDSTEQVGLDDFSPADGQATLDELEGEEEIDYESFYTNRDIRSEGIRPSENPVAHDSRNTVWGLAESYRRRWSIETAFRQVKYQFLARTASRDLGVRRFYWMLALLLYNSWACLNLVIQSNVPEWDYDRPPVKGNVFLVEMAKRLRPPPD